MLTQRNTNNVKVNASFVFNFLATIMERMALQLQTILKDHARGFEVSQIYDKVVS